MPNFFPSYSQTDSYGVTQKQEFDQALDRFFKRSNSLYVNLNQEFFSIENFLSYQNPSFFEETFLTTCSKIIQYLGTYEFNEKQVSTAQLFINMIKQDKFKKVLPKLQNYGTNNTFNFVFYLLNTNNINLAETITQIFIHPEKRTLKSFGNTNVIDWCLKYTKIAALKFLINNYDGFNDKEYQTLFLNYAELGEEYLSKVFPDNIYPHSLESSFQKFFNNSSIVLVKKLELISYFSKKTDFIPKELVQFIKSGLSDNNISVESLKKHDFFEKLYSPATLNNFLPLNSSNYIANIKGYLSHFIPKDKVAETIFNTIKSNKEYNQSIFNEFIKTFPEYIKSNSDLIKNYIIDNNFEISQTTYIALKSNISISDEFNNYLLKKNPDLYFFINNVEDDKNYLDKLVSTIFDKKYPPSVPDSIYDKHAQKILDKMLKKYGNNTLFELFFMNDYTSSFFTLLNKGNITLAYNLDNISENKLKQLGYNLGGDIKKELSPKKWYQVIYDKPLQIVYKDNEFSIIKKSQDKIIISNVSEFDSQDSLEGQNDSISNIIVQAKKDLNKFNQLTSQPLDFNLEFKIRSESIFMQQMNFLNQIQKIENELNFEDLYFLKNNLGKYLIQCTETYSRALTRYQTLLENPGLFKKQDSTLEAQKEKIDNEALKQVSLLEKELEFVKENVIKTINSDSVSDMRVNTRFLEATVEHGSEEGIVKLLNTKPR